jgi:hypothetical protein
MNPKALAAVRFMRCIEITSTCWNWVGPLDGNGYGRFYTERVGRRAMMTPAHRYSYTLFVEPIPDDLHVDHLCRNHICVRPDHLQPVTVRENSLRRPTGRNKTHCARGHPYNDENTMWRTNGRRGCRACAREDMAAKRQAGYVAPSRR